MNLTAQFFAIIAAVLHVLFFCMESLWFMRPGVYRRFGVRTTEEAESKRLFAFNQGFYNLFLAVGVFVGIGVLHGGGDQRVAGTLILFSCVCMFCAGMVLLYSGGRRLLRASLIQAIFPFLAILAWIFL